MKIIGAGLSKTGTKTLNAALTILGYSVFDSVEHFEKLATEWSEVASGNTDKLREMYKDIDAGVDVPIYCFWEELLEAFPDAKVILTIRDNEDDFVRSTMRQLETNNPIVSSILAILSPSYRNWMNWLHRLLDFTYLRLNDEWADAPSRINLLLLRQSYRRHNAHVKQACPKEKLLVFNCKEGWDPLCRFLGVPVPKVSFPHKNANGEMANEQLKAVVFKALKRDLIRYSVAIMLFSGIAGLLSWRVLTYGS